MTGIIVNQVQKALVEAGASEAKVMTAAEATPVIEHVATKQDIANLKGPALSAWLLV